LNVLRSLLSRAVVFLKRQESDWKITVLRTSLDRFAYQTVFPRGGGTLVGFEGYSFLLFAFA
jgi:hypothetical protein